MTACDVAALPPTVQAESIVTVLPDFCMSRLEHAAWANGPAPDCIIWSVAASMHCAIAWPAPLRFSKLILTAHRPALRVGNSAATAGSAPARIRIAVAPNRIMRASSCVKAPTRLPAGLVLRRHDQRPEHLVFRLWRIDGGDA